MKEKTKAFYKNRFYRPHGKKPQAICGIGEFPKQGISAAAAAGKGGNAD